MNIPANGAVGAIADALLGAHDRAERLALPSAGDAGFDIDMAYAVADEIRRRRLARGERPLGYKIGFTNRSIWDRYGVHAPIWGPVWDTTVAPARGTAHVAPLAGLVQPRLEPEIMFGFAASPHAGMSDVELVGCLEWVAHGFEIVQTHFDDWRFRAADTVADFALHGRLFIGERVPVDAFGSLRHDLSALRIELHRNGELVDEGVGAVVLDGPLDALRLWIDAMQAQSVRWPIAPGDVVTTGTLTDAWPLVPGEVWETRLSDRRLPGVSLRTRP